MKLTTKREAFAQHYVLHGVGEDAYKAAGYAWKRMTPNTLAVEVCKLKKNPKVSQRIAELQARKAKRMEAVFDISVDRIAQELAALGFSNMQDYVKVDDKTGENVSLAFNELSREQFAAVQEITIEDIVTGVRTGKRTKFKLADKRGALVDLGKHLGMFKEQHEHKHEHEFINDAATDFDSRIAGLFARATAPGVPSQLN